MKNKNDLTISITKVIPFLTLLKGQRILIADFLLKEGIDPAITDSPDARLSLVTLQHLIQKAVDLTGDAYLGLHAGEIFTNFSSILGYILMNCSTIGEAIEKYCEYEKIVDEGKLTKLHNKGNSAIIEIEMLDCKLKKERHLIDYYLAGFVTYFNLLIKKNAKKTGLFEVHFSYVSPDNPIEYQRVFPCRLKFNSPHNALVFNASLLNVKIPQPNRELLELFEKYARDILTKISSAETITNQVSRIVMKRLDGTTPTIGETAEKMAMSKRNLQLKLKDEGTTFSEILNSIRRDLAIEYVKDKTIPLSEISYLLGFSEPSVFHRTFKRWTQSTPGMFRQK